jgi:hypothetical protein
LNLSFQLSAFSPRFTWQRFQPFPLSPFSLLQNVKEQTAQAEGRDLKPETDFIFQAKDFSRPFPLSGFRFQVSGFRPQPSFRPLFPFQLSAFMSQLSALIPTLSCFDSNASGDIQQTSRMAGFQAKPMRPSPRSGNDDGSRQMKCANIED